MSEPEWCNRCSKSSLVVLESQRPWLDSQWIRDSRLELKKSVKWLDDGLLLEEECSHSSPPCRRAHP
jgi:hypothetical protein